MSNRNGLISSTDVASTGDPSSDFFLRKGEPVAVPSPIQVLSPNGGSVGSISEDNTGNLSLTSPAGVVIAPTNQTTAVAGNGTSGSGLVVKPQNEVTGAGVFNIQNGVTSATPTRYSLYDASVVGGGLNPGNLQLFGYSGVNYGTIREIFEFIPTGAQLTFGDASTVGGAIVRVNGSTGVGRVYDDRYNLPPSTIGAVVASIGSGNTVTNNTILQSSQFQVPKDGYYQYTAGFSIGFSDGSPAPSIPAGVLQFWVQDITAGAFSMGNSQVAVSNTQMTTRPTSTAITDYLTSPNIQSLQSAPIYLYAGANYRFRCAWWSDAPLAFGALGNQIGANLYAIN